ncbi:hypothetical protein [Pseudogemmobacter humi]|uniref:hypothetical protein n=1 Tax=Pseudogemmobacter humi TaxID=2483812 RepID=UPI000F531D95|nr:hypothetical protein [Pseudogemmobacter humi]
MLRFDLDDTFYADAEEMANVRIGEIHHILRNKVGTGSVSTPVARYFAWRPKNIEGCNPHWRIDCFVRDHKLSGDPQTMAKLLTANLRKLGLCDLPIWISWHQCSEHGGEKLGDLWEPG